MSLVNLMVSIKKCKKPFKNIKIRLRQRSDLGRNHRRQPELVSPRWTVEQLCFMRAGNGTRGLHPESRRRDFFLFVRAGSAPRVSRPRVETSSCVRVHDPASLQPASSSFISSVVVSHEFSLSTAIPAIVVINKSQLW